MYLLKSLLLTTAVFFAFMITGCSATDSGPNLWRVSDEDTTIYIFGTIHILDKDVKWTTPQLLNAMAEADALVLELSPDQEDPTVLNPLIVKYGLLTGGETLKTILSEEDYTRMVGIIEDMGSPGNAFDSLQPWLASTVLTVQVAATHGFLPEFGVEKILENMANDKGIPVLGLETAEYQIRALASHPMEDQKIFMRQTLDEIGQINEIFVEMRDLWLAGDTEGLDALLNEGFDEIPDFAEAILYQRNRNWVTRIDVMLDKPGTFLMAVGTGHLIGQQNLLGLLEKDGLEVTLVTE